MLNLTTFQVLYSIYVFVLLFWFIGGGIGSFLYEDDFDAESCLYTAELSYLWPVVTLTVVLYGAYILLWLWWTEPQKMLTF
jgi:hypothetical protein